MNRAEHASIGSNRGCVTATVPILLAHDNDTDGLVIQSGHEDKTVMWESYYRATTKEKAKEFWSIRPPKRGSKIVPFAA
jgi:hypothetical protein